MSRIPSPYALVALAFGTSLLACATMESAPSERYMELEAAPPGNKSSHVRSANPDAGEGAKAKPDEGGAAFGKRKRAMPAPMSEATMDVYGDSDGAPIAPEAEESAADEGAPTRAWFPETFLFEPEVITGPDGTAEVLARVPDRLTTWRVLGLAHDKAGHQAGDVTEFTSSLPMYADPVVPAQLRVGDRARLAIPVVNTTATPASVVVDVQASGLDIRGGGSLRLPAHGSGVATAVLAATQPGSALVHADIKEAGVTRDAVEHTIPVIPTGRRQASQRTGTLGAPRTVALPLPTGADPASAEARLTIVPGGLGVVQSEVSTAAQRTWGTQGAAVLLQLAAVAPRLWQTAGLPVADDGADPEARARWQQVRELLILSVQRSAQTSGHLALNDAIMLTAAASMHSGDPLIDAMAQRGLMSLAQHRHPDGTFGGSSSASSGWTVQRMLVATGAAVDAVRTLGAATEDDALRRSVQPHIVLGTGAAERFAGRVVDAYTASALLSADLVEGDAKERLLGILRESIKSTDTGATVALPEGVLRIDGGRPQPAEAAALAARALARVGSDDDKDRIADLGATVLSSFQPGRGWGDLTTDYSCLRAVAELWSEAPSEAVTLTLSRGGQTRAARTLAVDDLRDPVFLSVPATGDGPWTISAEPAVPGLAYGLELVSYTPWTRPPRDPGIDVEVQPLRGLKVGQSQELSIEIASAMGKTLALDVELPAGVQVDESNILIRAGDTYDPPLTGNTADGTVHLELEMHTGRVQVQIPISPTIAGTLWSGSVSVKDKQGGALTVLAPTAWTITGR